MSNPIMRLEERNAEQERILNASDVMTINGTLQITAFMGLILIFAAGFVWSKFSAGYTDFGMMLISIGAIVGFVLALIIAFGSLISTSIILMLPLFTLALKKFI